MNWLKTESKSWIRADQIIKLEMEWAYQNGLEPGHWRIFATCLNGLTFSGRILMSKHVDADAADQALAELLLNLAY